MAARQGKLSICRKDCSSLRKIKKGCLKSASCRIQTPFFNKNNVIPKNYLVITNFIKFGDIYVSINIPIIKIALNML